jgi:hypothetical protein
MSNSEQLDVYNEIQNKLNETQGVSYIKLSKKAFKYYKHEIGIKFLENEKSILTKIPQYLELRKWDKALELAIETHDSNVIYTVVDNIMTQEPMESFHSIVSKYRKAEPVIVEYLKVNHEGVLEDYLKTIKNWEGLFFHYLEKYFRSNSLDQRRIYFLKCQEYIKNLLVTDQKEEWKFYKNYIEEDLRKAIDLKRDLLKEEIIKQTDLTNFDSPTFDVYYNMFKNEKGGLVEIKNKQYFGVNN